MKFPITANLLIVSLWILNICAVQAGPTSTPTSQQIPSKDQPQALNELLNEIMQRFLVRTKTSWIVSSDINAQKLGEALEPLEAIIERNGCRGIDRRLYFTTLRTLLAQLPEGAEFDAIRERLHALLREFARSQWIHRPPAGQPILLVQYLLFGYWGWIDLLIEHGYDVIEEAPSLLWMAINQATNQLEGLERQSSALQAQYERIWAERVRTLTPFLSPAQGREHTLKEIYIILNGVYNRSCELFDQPSQIINCWLNAILKCLETLPNGVFLEEDATVTDLKNLLARLIRLEGIDVGAIKAIRELIRERLKLFRETTTTLTLTRTDDDDRRSKRQRSQLQQSFNGGICGTQSNF